MASSWHAFCQDAGLELGEDSLVVHFRNGRREAVRVQEEPDAFRLVATVARAREIARVDRPGLLAWRRNRAARLVGFRREATGDLVGEARVPKPGLTSEEFVLYARVVAAECDRFEGLHVGKDLK